MFLKILKRDLMKKKIMNIVLLLFIIISSMLVASSISQIYFTTGVVDNFIKISKTADFTTWVPFSEDTNKKIEIWAKNQDSIKSIDLQKQLKMSMEDITFPKECEKITDGTALILGELSNNNNLVFDQDDKKIDLKEGQIAISMYIKEKTGLKLEDEVKINIGNTYKTFKVRYFVKDALVGSSMAPIKNVFISTSDFEKLVNYGAPENILSCATFILKDGYSKVSLNELYSKSGLPATGWFTEKSLVKLSYIASYGIIAALLFAVSLLLLLISFLILRFTINLTIQDDYKQIGILKAIGLKNFYIRRIYLVKYLFISLVGGIIGFLLSIPLTNILAGNLVGYMVMPNKSKMSPIAAFCIMLVIIIVQSVCYMTMRKINKCSPIDAIRQGNKGERFKASSKMFLYKRGSMNSILFLALSDVLNNLRNYSSLIITFILCVSIIIIPVNIKNTMSNTKFLDYMGKTQGDIYIERDQKVIKVIPIESLKSDFNSIKERFSKNNEPINLYLEYYCMAKYSSEDSGYSTQLLGVKSALSSDKYHYLIGTGPKMQNEIAVHKTFLKNAGKVVGDYIEIEINDVKRKLLITGTFEGMINNGNLFRLSDTFQVEKLAMYDVIGVINGNIKEKSKLINDIKKRYPDLKIKNSEEVLKEATSSFSPQFNSFVTLIIVIASLIIFFITSLFVRLLLSKENQSIAILKSIGFTNKDLKLWQVFRILTIMLSSIITGIIISNILGEKLIGLVFGAFGVGKFSFTISIVQVYVYCPLILILIALVAVATSYGGIKNVQVYNINEE